MSSRIGALRLVMAPVPVGVVVAYAPVESAAAVDKEAFYGDRAVGGERAGRAVYVVGDFNAQVGGPRVGEKVLGSCALGERNWNGEAGGLGVWEGLALAKTFRKRRCRRLTWRAAGVTVGGTAQLDYVLVPARWRSGVTDIRVWWGKQSASDCQRGGAAPDDVEGGSVKGSSMEI